MCVALALVCISTICSSAAWGVYEKDFVKPEDLAAGIHDNISFNPDKNGLKLNDCAMRVPFLWVPSPATSTLTRIDARTGSEVARYRMGPAHGDWYPCAVAVDNDGNAYVACACPGSTGKVVRVSARLADSTGDGYAATSGDTNNKRISASEIMPWGADDCVGPVFEVGSKGASPSSIAFDNHGCLWVALRGDAQAVKMDPKTGKVLAMVDLNGRPTSIVSDGDNIWAVSRDQGTLCKVNTVTCTLTASYKLDDSTPVNVCRGKNGKLLVADLNGSLIMFDTEGESWDTVATDDGAIASIVLDRNEDIWAACPDTGNVICLSGDDGTLLTRIGVGNAPTALSMDDDGYLWALCDQNGCAVKINTNSEEKLASVNTGVPVYSSTPFAASVTKKGVCPQGAWRMLVDSEIQGAGWGKIDWDGQNTGGTIGVQVRTSDSPEMLNSEQFMSVANGVKFDVPEGRYMEVMVTFDGNGKASPVLYGLKVEGANLAPKVDKAWPSVAAILKRDHTLEPVSIEGISDPEGDAFSVQITGVEQDEPVSGLGKDDVAPDAICLNGSSVWLRGECDPGSADRASDGRVYVVSFKAVDEHGAASTGKVKVMVPPDGKDFAVEDMAKFDSYNEPDKRLCSNPAGSTEQPTSKS